MTHRQPRHITPRTLDRAGQPAGWLRHVAADAQPICQALGNQARRLVLIVLAALGGCSGADQSGSLDAEFIDPTVSQLHSLGWVGALTHPLKVSVTLPDPDRGEVTPGGVVLCEILEDGAAADTDLQKGDVLVRVAEDWLPNREDPTLDFIRLCEQQITAGQREFPVTVLRDGKLLAVSLQTDLGSLDDGLPLQVARYDHAREQGLMYLQSLQQEDGSFGVADNDDVAARLRATSLAGLAFIAGGASQEGSPFADSADRCREFLITEVDSRRQPAEPEPASEDGAQRAGAPATTLDPLTTAYALQFLAESGVPMLDRDWIMRIASLMATISEAQTDDGGWMTEQAEGERQAIDSQGTFVTNQVLLALGMLERRGIMSDNDLIERACAYLKQQAAARVSNPLDRRIKGALAAGSGAAMMALNCDRGDSFLQELSKENIERTAEITRAPQFALPGWLASGVLARQMGNVEWMQFHNAAKYQLSGLQQPDGSFGEVPKTRSTPHPLEASADGPAWRAAHLCLILGLQSDHLDQLTAQLQNPMMVQRDSSGKVSSGSSTARGSRGTPEGAQAIMLEGGDLDDVKERLRKKLEEMGAEGEIDLDNLETQVIEIGPDGPPADDESIPR